MSISTLTFLFALSTIFEVISIIAVLMILSRKIEALSTKMDAIYNSMINAQGFIQCKLSEIHGSVVGNEYMLKKSSKSLDLLRRHTYKLIEKDESFSVRLGGISRILESITFAMDLIGNEIRKKNEVEIEVGSGGSDEKSPENSPEKNDAK